MGKNRKNSRRRGCAAALAVLLSAALAVPAFAEAQTTAAETAAAEAAAPETLTEGEFTYEVTPEGTAVLTAWSGNAADLTIPAEIGGRPVTAIGGSCFAGNIRLERVHIPEGVKSIGDYAFECCSGLRKVYFPDSLVSIGDGAFSGCALMILADIQEGVQTIGKGAFLFCMSLASAYLPESLESVGDFAFAGCSNLAYAEFQGDKVTVLPDRLFYGCQSLTRVILPRQVKKVGNLAFGECASLKSVYFYEELEDAGFSVFSACESLVNVNLPSPVIRTGTFAGCSSLQNFQVAENTKTIEFKAFSSSAVKSLFLPAGVTDIQEGAFAGSQVSSVSLEDESVYQVIDGSLCADGGKTLLCWLPEDPYAEELQTSCTVRDGVEVIASYAFAVSRLQKIELPASVREIRSGAFADTQLENLKIPEGAAAAPDAFGEGEAPSFDPETGDRIDAAPDETAAAESAPELTAEAEKPAEEADAVPIADIVKCEPEYAGFREISNDEFADWSKEYVSFVSDFTGPSIEYMPYIRLYKGEAIPYYVAMAAALDGNESGIERANIRFGLEWKDMFLMMDHGLFTELARGKMKDDIVFYTGVYDTQLMAAAGTETVPTREELAACIGREFTDPAMISTTTDPDVACGFGDTLYIIYAPAEAVSELGAVSIDSFMGTNENEILFSVGARFRILDVGRMSVPAADSEGEEELMYRDYVKVLLLGGDK